MTKEEGVNAFKLHMAFKGTMMLTNAELLDAMEACRDAGAVAFVHAENGVVIAENEKRLLARGMNGPESHLMARPEEVEEEAVTRACAFARQVNVPLVLSGTTGRAAAAAAARAKARGQAIYVEPSALSAAADGSHIFNSCWTHAAGFVVSPPLRDDPAAPDAVVAALNDGTFDFVASHHKSYSSAAKEAAAGGQDDFTRIPSGANGVEDRMGVVWSRAVEANKMSPERFVAATSANAARALGIFPRKGRLEVSIPFSHYFLSLARLFLFH